MWRVGHRRRVVFLSLTTTKVLIIDVGRRAPYIMDVSL
jgi:predicted nucleic acid-binding Zn finger protein